MILKFAVYGIATLFMSACANAQETNAQEVKVHRSHIRALGPHTVAAELPHSISVRKSTSAELRGRRGFVISMPGELGTPREFVIENANGAKVAIQTDVAWDESHTVSTYAYKFTSAADSIQKVATATLAIDQENPTYQHVQTQAGWTTLAVPGMSDNAQQAHVPISWRSEAGLAPDETAGPFVITDSKMAPGLVAVYIAGRVDRTLPLMSSQDNVYLHQQGGPLSREIDHSVSLALGPVIDYKGPNAKAQIVEQIQYAAQCFPDLHDLLVGNVATGDRGIQDHSISEWMTDFAKIQAQSSGLPTQWAKSMADVLPFVQ